MTTLQERPPAYRKMRVIGPRQAVALDDVVMQHTKANAMRDYNPTLNAMAQSQTEMHDILEHAPNAVESTQSLPKRKKRVRKGITQQGPLYSASSSVALHNACLERLRALKSQFDTSYEPLLQLLVANNTPAAAPAPPVVAPPVHAQPGVVAPANAPAPRTPAQGQAPTTPGTTPPERVHAIDVTRVLNTLPKVCRDKYAQLHEYIARYPNLVGITGNGRMVIRGVTVHGSTYSDVVRALYVTPRTLGVPATPVPGLYELVDVLTMIGAPRSLVSSTAARAQYAANLMQSRENLGDHPTYSSSKPKQQGRGRVDSPCFPGQPIKCMRMY